MCLPNVQSVATRISDRVKRSPSAARAERERLRPCAYAFDKKKSIGAYGMALNIASKGNSGRREKRQRGRMHRFETGRGVWWKLREMLPFLPHFCMSSKLQRGIAGLGLKIPRNLPTLEH